MIGTRALNEFGAYGFAAYQGWGLVKLGIIALLTFSWGGTMKNRNYVSKNAYQRGCAFTDKKKAQKGGYTKHKAKARMLFRGCL